MAIYEFDVVTKVEPYTEANQLAELDRLFEPLRAQGAVVTVVALCGTGGGHPMVRVAGDPELIRAHMRTIGWDQEGDDGEFDEVFRLMEGACDV